MAEGPTGSPSSNSRLSESPRNGTRVACVVHGMEGRPRGQGKGVSTGLHGASLAQVSTLPPEDSPGPEVEVPLPSPDPPRRSAPSTSKQTQRTQQKPGMEVEPTATSTQKLAGAVWTCRGGMHRRCQHHPPQTLSWSLPGTKDKFYSA